MGFLFNNNNKIKSSKNWANEVLFDLKTVYQGHFQVTYRGISTLKSPFDFVLYQILLSSLMPDLIIEIGTHKGGGALYLADLMNNMNQGMVHTIDIQPQAEELMLRHPRIKYFRQGWQNYELKESSNFNKIMVIDDASHEYGEVLGSLRKFSPVVSKNSYFIVEDGIINALGLESQFHGGPLKAIEEFLKNNKEFVIDRKWCDFFGTNATFNVNGYLKRIDC
jgi:cephalosporin hydroxylase